MFSKKILLLALPLVGAVLAGCSEREISFKKNVMPILKANCLECHVEGAEGDVKAGLRMDTYEHLMKGTKHGPIILPGNSLSSVLNQVVEGRVDKSIRMPHGGSQIFDEDIKKLKDWVDQGAKNN